MIDQQARQGRQRETEGLGLNGNNTDIDLRRMMKVVMDSGYHGHAGIESGPEGREVEGVKELPQRLETVRDHLSARSL